MTTTAVQDEAVLASQRQVLLLQLLNFLVCNVSRTAPAPEYRDVNVKDQEELRALRLTIGQLINKFRQRWQVSDEHCKERNDLNTPARERRSLLQLIKNKGELTTIQNNERKLRLQLEEEKKDILKSTSAKGGKLLVQLEDEAVKLLVSTVGLRAAARAGDAELVKLVLRAGVAVDAADEYGYTALHWAVQNEHNATVRVLLDAGARVDAKTSEGETPLFLAAWRGRVDSYMALLAAGATVQEKDNEGNTAMHIAAANGRLNMCRVLLHTGADIDAPSKSKRTPLFWAAYWGQADVVWLLYQFGADRNMRDEDGHTPHTILIMNHPDVYLSLFHP